MLFTGIYNRGITLRFRYETSMLTKSFMVLSGAGEDVNPYASVIQVSGKVGYLNKSLILAHVITNTKNDIKYYYGNLDLATEFIKDLSESGLFDLRDSITSDTPPSYYKYFKIPKGSIELYSVKVETSASIKKVKGLDYNEFKPIEVKRSKLSAYVKYGNVRGLKELKSIYDLTWILDASGRLIRDYRSVRTRKALDEVIEGIKSHDIISLDFETTGTEFYYCMKEWAEEDQPKITGIGISWEEGTARYIPLMSTKFECLPYRETIDEILSLLQSKKIIGANLMFDFGVAYYHGYLLTCVFDVMIAEFDIDPTGSRGHKKLKEITRFYLGWETLELDEVLGGPVDGRLIPQLDEEVILIYGGADVDTVWSVMKRQKPYLKGKDLIWAIDMKMIPIIAIEDFYGCKMDMEVWNILNEINTTDMKNVERTIWKYLEEKALWKTVRQTGKLFYGEDLTNEDIIEIINLQPEIRSTAMELLKKKNTKKTKSDERLNLSSSRDLLYIFSEILEYPIYRNMGGKISLDEEYLIKLENITTDEPEHFLKEDLMSHSTTLDIPWVKNLPKDEKVILSKSELEKCKYPFVIMLKVWRKLTKRDNSFLAPIKDNSINGWYNRNTSMTAADTARFINPIQTLQGYLKKLDIAFDNNRYFVQFDLAQVEFRVMIGNAVRNWKNYCDKLPEGEVFDMLRDKSIEHLIDRLNIPWTDYHREGGSILVGTTPARMTKAERTRVKSAHFAVPYGAEAYTVAKPKLISAKSEVERMNIIQDTEEILMKWKKTMFPLHKYLETKRDIALQPVPDDCLPPRLKGGKWGRVVNSFGRCRYYSLDYETITEKRMVKDKLIDYVANKSSTVYQEYLAKTVRQVKGSIRRSAGNYPIQSDARELFAQIMIRLFNYCKEHGLSGTGSYDTDKIIQSLMIHDENHLQVSKDIHPFKIYEILIENCLLSYGNYPSLYMGIAVCDSWYESKDDKFEAPVQFVKDIVKEYKANPSKFENEDWKDSPKEYVLEYICKWMDKSCAEFIDSLTVDNVFDLEKFRIENDNYFFLTKPVLYTKKFLNEEDDISKLELVLLSHNHNPNLIVRTGKRDIIMKDYIWKYSETKTESPSNNVSTDNTDNLIDVNEIVSSDIEDILNVDMISDTDVTDDIDDLFDGIDFTDLFDTDDNDLKDADVDKCYWLYSEAERSFNTEAEIEETISELDISDEIPPPKKRKTCMACIQDTWIIDSEKLKGDKASKFVKFLEPYRVKDGSNKGLPVIMMTKTGAKVAKTRYTKDVDLISLEMILEN